MSGFRPEMLHVTFLSGLVPAMNDRGRRYTLTHSDVTGELFLSIGPRYDRARLRGFLARLLRDEVLAEWQTGSEGPALHVHCQVSGGLVLGPAGWRDATFRYHLPQVLQAFRYGDRELYQDRPELDRAPVRVHFHGRQPRYDRVEMWGCMGDYRLEAQQQGAGKRPESRRP